MPRPCDMPHFFRRRFLPALAIPAALAVAWAFGLLTSEPRRLAPLVNSIGMKFEYVPPGEFQMGTPKDARRFPERLWAGATAAAPASSDAWQPEGDTDEVPHRVRLTKGFYLAATEVTQGQWKAVMGTTVEEQRDALQANLPLAGTGDARPIYYVSWNQAVEFCERLGLKEGRKYRLPTEAEWEYACRAGTRAPFHTGKTLLSDAANFNGRFTYAREDRPGAYRRETTPAAAFPPNAWGLYDMHGNVWEWCADWYGPYPDSGGVAVDPAGPPKGVSRVLRGGSWYDPPSYCRSANRYCLEMSPIQEKHSFATRIGNNNYGFRPALDP